MKQDQVSASMPQSDNLKPMIDYIHQHGLATPALMLLTLARPLGFIGGQCLRLMQPFAPGQQWQTRIARTAATVEDAGLWQRLENLLQYPED